MPPMLTWTTEKPTKPGWYKYRAISRLQEQTVHVVVELCMGHYGLFVAQFGDSLLALSERLPLDSMLGEWARPIAPPEG